MTVAEVMVAALILAISSLAVLNLVASGARTNYRAEQSQVVSDRLQSEMEQVKQLADNANYDRIALSTAPAHSADPNSPDYRVSGTSYNVLASGTLFRPLVLDAAAGMAPTSSFSTGDVHGTIHRYVTWEPDSACDACKKRVIVAIQLDATASGGVRHYQELQSVIADPRAPERENPIPPPPGQPKPWTFWLTDTPCNNTDRQPLTGDHLTHNTRGVCLDGLRDADDCASGCAPGAPDLMVTHPPQLSSEAPIYNFATDVLSQNPSQDKGLRLVKAASSGCPALDIAQSPESGASPRYKEIHKWLSPPVPSGFNVQLDGNGTLNLWTRAVGNQSYAGRICIWLFQRSVNGSGVTQDTAALNLDGGSAPYFQYSANPWPKPKWQELAIPIHLSLGALAAGSQLGLALQVERTGTSGGGLQFIYDEPSYESRLELRSASSLPCGASGWPGC